jgi:hypothetical protein
MPAGVTLDLVETSSDTLVIGVGGPELHRNGQALEIDTNLGALTVVRGAPGVGPNDFVTVAQLGGGLGDQIVSVPFTFSSGSLVLGAIAAGSMIIRAQILINTAFNGSGASIRFGTSSNLSEFLGVADSAPTIVDQYASFSVVIQPAADVMFLTVSAPGATQGAGVLLYELFTP